MLFVGHQNGMYPGKSPASLVSKSSLLVNLAWGCIHVVTSTSTRESIPWGFFHSREFGCHDSRAHGNGFPNQYMSEYRLFVRASLVWVERSQSFVQA